jgi:hypothetical protein
MMPSGRMPEGIGDQPSAFGAGSPIDFPVRRNTVGLPSTIEDGQTWRPARLEGT